MNKGACKECKKNQNQRQICYLCYDCEHYGICDCSKLESSYEEQKQVKLGKVKLKLYKMVLKMILKDRNELSLTSKQKSQVESLIKKCN